MTKTLITIAVVTTFAAAVGLTGTKSEHAPSTARPEVHMPSILNMMSDTRDLPFAPLVAP